MGYTMTKLTQQEIEHKQGTFVCMLLSKLRKRKDFDLNFFNAFIATNEDGTYKNNLLQEEFEGWLARAELAKGGE